MQEGKENILCERSMKNRVNRDTSTVLAYINPLFSLRLQKNASGLPWQQVTSQPTIKFIKKMLKHILLTFKTTFKYTVFIQLEETLR